LVSSPVMDSPRRSYSSPSPWLAPRLTLSPLTPWPVEEENPAFWNQKAAEALNTAKKLQPIQTAAKNLILFLGDGERARPAPRRGPHVPAPTAGPGPIRGLGLTGFCSFRNGGVYGDSHPDPERTVGRSTGA
jgi:hypothetical protein